MSVSAAITLSSDTRTTSGVLLLTLVAVEFGGLFVLRLVRGRQPATPFQRSFARAGHAHAGVLVILALVGLILADAAALDGIDDFLARTGIWVAAILFPVGFFLSSAGGGRTEPNRLIVLLYAGVASLTVGVVHSVLGFSMPHFVSVVPLAPREDRRAGAASPAVRQRGRSRSGAEAISDERELLEAATSKATEGRRAPRRALPGPASRALPPDARLTHRRRRRLRAVSPQSERSRVRCLEQSTS